MVRRTLPSVEEQAQAQMMGLLMERFLADPAGMMQLAEQMKRSGVSSSAPDEVVLVGSDD
ncbi:MAG TPA: hypothetical protein VFB74_34935 [Kribbellaceae bacterium]|nr:hypothetical protein [Kribbellaceae bacterium]